MPRAHPDLVRLIGVRALTLNSINVIVGVGIYGLPAVVALQLGSAAVLAYLVCAVLVALVGLALAEAGSRVTRPGGLYAYAEEAFGPLMGSFVGTLMWFANGAIGNAAVAALLLETLGKLLPPLSGSVVRSALLVALYVALGYVNVRGVRGGIRLAEVVTVTKLLPLILLVLVGAFFVQPANLAWDDVPPLDAIAQASVVLFFAFMGVETGLSTSGEVLNPNRTVPRGILLSTAAVALLYFGIQVVAQGVLGSALAAQQATPLAAVAQAIAGPPGFVFVLAAMAFSAFGVMTSDVLSNPRVLFAQSRDGLLPARLGAIHERYGTPHAAVIVYTTVCCLLALSGTFRLLAIVGAACTLVMYLICCGAVLVLRRRGVCQGGRPFTVPGGPLVPLAACAVIAVLLWNLKSSELLAVLAVLIVAAIPYLFRRKRTMKEQTP